MSQRCCTTSRRSGLVLGGFLAHFEPIIEGFKAQTRGIERRRIGDRFWSFLKGKSLKKKEIEEKEITLSLKIVYSHPLSLFLSLLMLFFYLEMF